MVSFIVFADHIAHEELDAYAESVHGGCLTNELLRECQVVVLERE